MRDDPYSKAEAAYAILKNQIDHRFPRGRFVAIAFGKLVADADTIEGLKFSLATIGLVIDGVAIDQAGIKQEVEYLGWMVTEAMLGHWIKCVLPADK